MRNTFEIIKEKLNIIEVAESYGMELDRHKKALCPFHSDTHPSLSFKDNYFKCFACDASGSVIDLTMGLFDISPIEAVKKLNSDFDIGLDLKGTYTANTEFIEDQKRRKVLLKSFNSWKDRAYSEYAEKARHYWENMEKYKPEPWHANFHPLYVEALHKWEVVNYFMDILVRGSPSEQIEFLKNSTSKEVTPFE